MFWRASASDVSDCRGPLKHTSAPDEAAKAMQAKKNSSAHAEEKAIKNEWYLLASGLILQSPSGWKTTDLNSY
jgi:hypothetical protein